MQIASNRLPTRIIALSALALCVGCSSFNRDWRQALKTPGKDSVAGCWKGSWQSQTNFHRGGLRCIITPDTDDAAKYQARFHATYRGVIPFEYVMPMAVVQQSDGSYVFSGQADLGVAAGGVYKYKGTVRENIFESLYDSRHDDGTFFMVKQVPTE